MKNYMEKGTVWILKPPNPSGEADETFTIDYVSPSGHIHFREEDRYELMMDEWQQHISDGLLRPAATWPNFERVEAVG